MNNYESDGVFIALIAALAGLCVFSVALSVHRHNNYLIDNKCKVLDKSVPTDNGPRVLWTCKNDSHYVSH